jgi:DNA polymerase-3 subunit delta
MASDLKPVYLLTGNDRPKVARALERLRGRFGDDSAERLSAASASADEAIAACNSLGLFGGGSRLVVVTDVERWKAADVKAVAAYAASPAPATVLALHADEVKRDAALVKICAKHGSVLAYDVSKKELPKWVGEEFVRRGSRAESETCKRLIELVGDDLYELESEIDKLATWAAGAAITEGDVEAMAAGRAETSHFKLTDAWGARDVRGTLAAAQALLEQASDSRREQTRLAGQLAGHATRLRECQRLDAEGIGPKEGATRLKRHPFYVEKLYRQAANFSVEELRDAVVRFAQLDLALKGGSRLPGDLELERTLVEVTRAP